MEAPAGQGSGNIVTLNVAGLLDTVSVGAGIVLTIRNLRFIGNIWLDSLNPDQLKYKGSNLYNHGNCLWPGITIQAGGQVSH